MRKNIPPSPLLDARKAAVDKTKKRKDLGPKKLVRKVTQRVYRRPGDQRISSSDEEMNDDDSNEKSSMASKGIISKLMEKEEERAKSCSKMAADLCKPDNDTKRSQDVTGCNKHDDTPIICMERAPEETEEPSVPLQEDVTKEEKVETRSEELVAAAIVKVPADVTVFQGNRVVLRVTYRGHPEPRVKWLRAVNIVYTFRSVPLSKRQAKLHV